MIMLGMITTTTRECQTPYAGCGPFGTCRRRFARSARAGGPGTSGLLLWHHAEGDITPHEVGASRVAGLASLVVEC
jgi:hypothetical protein